MKIALIGYGKMGKEVENLALRKGHDIVCIIDSENDWEQNLESLKEAEVAIEFTQPSLAVENILKCFEISLPVVCGTTAWLDQIPYIRKQAEDSGNKIIFASNFSIGVNLFFKMNEFLARMMNSHSMYDVEIEEIHHTQKLDAPSGTAISLAQQIIENLDRKEKWVKEEEEMLRDLPIKSLRINDVTGIHSVCYASEIDAITIKHEAFNRKGFAAGAVLAAERILELPFGCFDFKDVLFNKV